MGRHSAPSRIRPRLQRTGSNLAAVVLVTSLTTLAVFVGISLYATAKARELPEPLIVQEARPFGLGRGEVVVPPVEQFSPGRPQRGGVDAAPQQPDAAMRVCPATGCAASSCHAETGEPIPSR